MRCCFAGRILSAYALCLLEGHEEESMHGLALARLMHEECMSMTHEGRLHGDLAAQASCCAMH